jgi:uncharacterized surface protein with fasciclin (FAS1) repeats
LKYFATNLHPFRLQQTEELRTEIPIQKGKTMTKYFRTGAVMASLLITTAAFAASPANDIVDTAISAGSFNTLVAAVKAAGLADTLKGAGPFTVFAPTDEAFAKLPAGTVEELLKPENKSKLQAILTYHVVPGNVMAKDVVKLSKAKTVNGQALTVKTEAGAVIVDGAKVVKTDIGCSNGVIHVIDSVVLPN